jgi:molybdopterin converting factor small subunit
VNPTALRVLIPSPLRPYTGRSWVDAQGATLAAVLDDLDRRYPGIRFRMVDEQEHIRPHVRVFVGGAQVFDLDTDVRGAGEILIVQALSGG